VTARAAVEEWTDRLVARHGGTVLYEYVFRPALTRLHAPRPYFHPVRSLAGAALTDHQPADHVWHLGLAHSWPIVDRWNLWGGPTYLRDRGYVPVANHGQMLHRRWDGRVEELNWVDGGSAPIAAERRTIGEPVVDEAAGAWLLDLDSEIENRSPAPLRLGSPTTEGRPMAGYAGLAWRGPEAMRGAGVVLDDGAWDQGAAMGRRSRWLACVGGGVTVAFFEHAANPRVPNRWFVRTAEYPLVTSSPVFDRELVLAPGQGLRLRHRVLFADGEWDAARLERAAADADNK
jgi:hypothetical protein